MKIAMVADTHIPTAISELPPRLIEHLGTADLIVHAGDFVCLDVLESLQKVTETIAVHGNADEPDVVRLLPRKQSFTVADKTIGIIHGNQAPEIEHEYLKPDYNYDSPPVSALYEYLFTELPEAEIIIFGHLNLHLVNYKSGRLLINPGSVAPYRGRCSFGLLHIDAGKVETEIVEL
jgi:putative phosphoesterase